MIEDIFKLIKLKDYYGDSKVIDVAKGSYKIPETFIEAYKQFKRDLAWRLRKQ